MSLPARRVRDVLLAAAARGAAAALAYAVTWWISLPWWRS
jgi:hypothetical protein